MRKQTNQNLSFTEIAECLKTTHTLSTRMICEILKTYRPWVSKYILPKLDKIYLNSGYKGNSKNSIDINWVYAMSKVLDDETFSESAWYKKSDFEQLLKESLTSCTRQTIKVSSSMFVDKKFRNEYCMEYKILENELNDLKEILKTKYSPDLIKQKKIINDNINSVYDMYIGSKIIKELKSKVSIDEYTVSKRTLAKPENYSIPIDYNNFMAVHDLKGYGGIDELIYRKLFNNGAIKLIFNFKSENGDIGEKIFYLYDNKDKIYRIDDGSPKWTVPYSFFLKYKKE